MIEIRSKFLGFLIFIGFFLLIGKAGDIENHYWREGEVVEKIGSVLIIEDQYGDVWEYEDSNFQLGQHVKMKIFTNCTDGYIDDDEISKLK